MCQRKAHGQANTDNTSSLNGGGSPLDIDAALEQVQGEAGFLRELYTVFISEIPERLDSFQSALKFNRRTQIVRLAHSLKGASLTIGAVSCGRLASDIETVGLEASVSDLQSLYAMLEQELAEVEAAIRQFLNDGNGAAGNLT